MRCANPRWRGSSRSRLARDAAAVEAALAALTHCAESGEGNLLDLAVKASRVRATVGEISDALKGVGRYRANPQSVSGVYGAVVEEMDDWKALKADIEAFVAEEGRRPRIMIAKLGQDGHDRGAKVVASAFADLGFDIDVGPLFQTPEEAAATRSRTMSTRSAVRAWRRVTRPWCRPSSTA